jgi:hypothetical protein
MHIYIYLYEHMTRKLKMANIHPNIHADLEQILEREDALRGKGGAKDRKEELTQVGAARSTARLNAGRQRLPSQLV